MKTKWMIACLMFLFTSITSKAESIAVTNFSTNGISSKPEMVAKMARLEMVKMEKYSVLDEFDMAEVLEKNPQFYTCYGKSCLVELGKKFNVDYILSGSIDGFENKMVITIKLIDVNNGELKSTRTMEFDDQESELQRMLGIILYEMHGLTPDVHTKAQLEFKNDVITSNNVGRVNNSGPRVGFGYVGFGDLNEYFTRSESQGGLEILPVMSNIGYQFEGQYIGTENFSALAEFILNIGGMEQGQFIPSLTLLNGFRFVRAGWEFAFGPGIGLRTTTKGIFSDGNYYRQSEWETLKYDEWRTNPDNVNQITGEVYVNYVAPDPSVYTRNLDKRGSVELSANWVMAFGRTFRSGALNIPVNIYSSSNKYGLVLGASVGFNVNKRTKLINQD